MNNTKFIWVGILIAIVLAVGAYSFPKQDITPALELGRAGSSFPRGIQLGEGLGNACLQIYATSTATVGKLVASTTATIEGVDGVMMFQYGSCL